MNAETCIICGAIIPEGRQVCPQCEKILEPNAEVMDAMFKKYPVEYDGIKYGCISAFTIRTRASHLNALLQPFILQVELMSKNAHCVVIADPQKVKILKDYQKNEREGKK